MVGRATSASRASRPRAVWIALVAAPTAIVVIALGVLVPVLALVGSADATTVGALDVPVGGIAVALLIGYGLAVLLSLAIARVRSPGLAWPGLDSGDLRRDERPPRVGVAAHRHGDRRGRAGRRVRAGARRADRRGAARLIGGVARRRPVAPSCRDRERSIKS